ncbi:MAG: class I SAM-dependent methyltransferase [Pseudomonadota bacterium]
MTKPKLLSDPFFPDHADNRMVNEGGLDAAREAYFDKTPSNLHALLEQRFAWMNAHLAGLGPVYEVGCGAGFSKAFIDHPDYHLTDVTLNDWVDLEVDALNMPFADESVGAIVASHMIHHLATPQVFFDEVRRVLKPGGRLVISEINTSLMMRLLLKTMRHEGYGYNIDVFDPEAVANRAEDPWSANCAVPELLFEDETAFEARVDGFKIIHNRLCECLLFPLSGGVIAKTRTINLPKRILSFVRALDEGLVKLAPGVFALGREVVIEKVH